MLVGVLSVLSIVAVGVSVVTGNRVAVGISTVGTPTTTEVAVSVGIGVSVGERMAGAQVFSKKQDRKSPTFF